ncbi:hypothetical protein [Streptosporangium sp. NPDC051022]|uniref:hypothetical protein n=1 Tax=Streptosporangium sp. NPDC051022 TaxID=3155752 RepID=UPI00343B93D7
MYETRAYDNDHGDPVIVIVATGTHDVSRLAQLLNTGNSEQVRLARQVLNQVRRHNGGRAALRLLAEHGGPDLLTQVGQTPPLFDPPMADMPLPPVAGDADPAERLIKAYAGLALYDYALARRIYPGPSGGPEKTRRWALRYGQAALRYGIVLLLRELAKRDPAQANEVTNQLLNAWDDGGDEVSDWLVEWGIDAEKVIQAGYQDALTVDVYLGAATDEEHKLRAELARQDEKFGEQNHPDGTGEAFTNEFGTIIGPYLAKVHQRLCLEAADNGTLTWRHILLEEVYEALAETDPERLKAELLQVAAVAMQWRRAIDRWAARAATNAEVPAGGEKTSA